MLPARLWLGVFSARDLVYFRSISRLPSHCVWGLGFLSPVFLLLIYEPEFLHSFYAPYKKKKKKLHLNSRFIWPVGQHLLKDDLLLMCNFHCLHQMLTGAGSGVSVLLGEIPCASSHTRAAGAPRLELSTNSIRSQTDLGCTIHQVHPSWGLDSLVNV